MSFKQCGPLFSHQDNEIISKVSWKWATSSETLILQKRKQAQTWEEMCLIYLLQTHWVLGMQSEVKTTLLGGQIGKQIMSVQGDKCCNRRMGYPNIRWCARCMGTSRQKAKCLGESRKKWGRALGRQWVEPASMQPPGLHAQLSMSLGISPAFPPQCIFGLKISFSCAADPTTNQGLNKAQKRLP